MEQFVEYIVKNLVDAPDAVKVVCLKGQKEVLVEIRVGAEDTGKVVGRRGETINSLRTLLSLVAYKTGYRAHLELIE